MRCHLMAVYGLCATLLAPQALAQESGETIDELREQLDAQQERLDELEQSRFSSPGASSSGPDASISGFLNTGFQSHNLGDTTYRPAAAATDGEFRATNFTTAGLQINARVTDKVSGTLQMVSEGQEDFDTRLEWAYLTYEVSPSLKVRAGRLVAPFFMKSQSFFVGYAHTRVEPTPEVYDTLPIRGIEGADITWQFNTGDIAHRLNAWFGSSSVPAPGFGRTDSHNQTGINLSSSMGNFDTWLAYSIADVDFQLEDSCVTPGLEPSPVGQGNPNRGCLLPSPPPDPAGRVPFSNYSFDNRHAYFGSLGFEYDNGDVMVQAEHVELDIKGWFPRSPAQYITVGYHFGNWTPHLTWANSDEDSFDEVRGDRVAEQLYNGTAVHQKSWNLGLRGDVAPRLALKAEVSSYYDIGANNVGVLGRSQDSGSFTQLPSAAPNDEDDPMVFRLSANLVF